MSNHIVVCASNPYSKFYVVGDIHGCYNALMTKLDEIGFRFEHDHLFALGDLVDRGKKNMEVLRLLNEPWFSSVKGNHEDMLCVNYLGMDNARLHRINGGAWFDDLDQTEKDEAYLLVKDLPLAMTVYTSRRKYGLVHADIPTVSVTWTEFTEWLANDIESAVNTALWGRSMHRVAKNGLLSEPMPHVDQVYMGHTPTKRPLRAANLNWIDMGTFSTGLIHVEELQ